ncbi:MAG: membrane protein insertion efficiency factor YidD [Hyphomicrobiaceae bacterium]|nr:membrane protein insertion efficiency factor YidD [Hyphomicrobiaceae bacterium]
MLSPSRWPRLIAVGLIRIYRHSLSAFFGRTCRHLPTCSSFGEEAIGRYGLWAGGWMLAARLWRCRPLGSSGLDPVPDVLPADAHWYSPWRYGRWTGAHIPPENRLG